MPNPQTPKKTAASARPAKTPAPAAKAPITSLTLPSRFRPRLLPVTIFVAVLMLGVRVGDIWLALGGDMRGPVGAVQAQEPAAPPKPAAQPFKTDAGLPPLNPAAKVMTAAVDEHAPEGPGSLQAEVFQRLTERREELDRRTRELDQREALLTAAQQRIDQKVTELTELRTNIEGLLRQVDEKQTAQLESLVKIYETMKPKDAARIFEALEMPVLLDVVERMREGKSAPVLAAMDPLKAKEVTASLIERRALPTLPK